MGFAAMLEQRGGKVVSYYMGPEMIPLDLRYHLRPLVHVAVIDVSEIEVDDNDMSDVSACKHLYMLKIPNKNISDNCMIDIGRLRELEYLDLSGSGVTDAGVAHLKSLHKLLWIGLHDTKVTAQGKDTIRSMLPNCVIDPE